MKIVNKTKFFRMLVILLISISIMLIVCINKSYSNSNENYKTEIVLNGDSLWSIAKSEIEKNKYFKNKDIRDVIFEIKKVNNLEKSDLSEGMKLKIPIY